MLKHTWIALMLVGASLTSSAQLKVTVGTPYEVIDSPSKYYFSERGQILTLKVDKKRIILQKMDAQTLAFKSLKVYEDFPKDYVIEKVTEFKNRYYLFYSLYENDSELLFSREIDFVKGEFIGKGKKISTVNEKITGSLAVSGFYRFSVADKYDFYFSYDSTAMVVQYRVKPDKRNDAKSYDKIGMRIFDKDLNEKWSKNIEMPYTEKKMDNLDYSVDAAGNVYIVTRVFDDNTTDVKKRGEDDANYHLEILKVAAGSGTISTTQVQVKDKFVQKLWLYEAAAKGTMVCAGFYNKGENTGNADGIIMFRLGQDGKLTNMNTFEIPLEILNQNVKGKERRKNERKEGDDEAEFSNLVLEHVVVQPDASIVLIGEKQYSRTHTSYSNGRSSSYTTYHAEDILVTKVDPSGKLAWMKKIPKRQQSGVGFYGISYRYFHAGNVHLFLFLDNEKNITLAKDKVLAPALHVDGQGGFLTAYGIEDKSGVVVQETILDTRNVNGVEVFQFSPTRLVSPLPNTLVFEAYKKKKEDVLVKIVF
ncbi:hypothetical protein [Chryseolinea sp. H1M3-3]|uniref:hypothetical protein n=1 Tax=Chryseolinea sp. H1M3-3 TaxID=3034144 RepID=UPI0023EC9796|nr:hypothetical protein [Chryseolinea sp. H1M3-3]